MGRHGAPSRFCAPWDPTTKAANVIAFSASIRACEKCGRWVQVVELLRHLRYARRLENSYVELPEGVHQSGVSYGLFQYPSDDFGKFHIPLISIFGWFFQVKVPKFVDDVSSSTFHLPMALQKFQPGCSQQSPPTTHPSARVKRPRLGRWHCTCSTTCRPPESCGNIMKYPLVMSK